MASALCPTLTAYKILFFFLHLTHSILFLMLENDFSADTRSSCDNGDIFWAHRCGISVAVWGQNNSLESRLSACSYRDKHTGVHTHTSSHYLISWIRDTCNQQHEMVMGMHAMISVQRCAFIYLHIFVSGPVLDFDQSGTKFNGLVSGEPAS